MQSFHDTVILRAPLETVISFYTDLRNLERMTPPDMRMRVVRAELPLRKGSRVTFSVHPSGLPFKVKWESVIAEFIPNQLFLDKQVHGPFDHWVHRHEFRQLADGRTEVTDTIEVGAPLGFIGKLAEKVLLGARVRHMFEHRRHILRSALEHRQD